MDKKTTIEFFDSRAETWDSKELPETYGVIARQLSKINLKEHDAVADIGCGTGILTPFLLRAGAEITAIDISPKMCAVLNKKFPKVNVITADFETLALPQKHFDKILIFNAFPHFEDKLRVFEQAFNALKHGGGLFIFHSMSRAALAKIHGGKGPVKKDLIPPDNVMEDYYKTAGFERITVQDAEGGFFSCGYKN